MSKTKNRPLFRRGNLSPPVIARSEAPVVLSEAEGPTFDFRNYRLKVNCGFFTAFRMTTSVSLRGALIATRQSLATASTGLSSRRFDNGTYIG
jgi:hypothetical protein